MIRITPHIARLCALGVVGITAASGAAAEPRNWLSRTPAATAPAAERPPVLSRSAEAMTEAIRAESDAFARRLEVCTKLRKIAAETNDNQLAKRALELEQLAEDTYRQRRDRLGVKSDLRTLPATGAEAAHTSLAARKPDAQPSSPAMASLERSLGAGATPLTIAPPQASSPLPATAQARQFREVPQ